MQNQRYLRHSKENSSIQSKWRGESQRKSKAVYFCDFLRGARSAKRKQTTCSAGHIYYVLKIKNQTISKINQGSVSVFKDAEPISEALESKNIFLLLLLI